MATNGIDYTLSGASDHSDRFMVQHGYAEYVGGSSFPIEEDCYPHDLAEYELQRLTKASDSYDS